MGSLIPTVLGLTDDVIIEDEVEVDGSRGEFLSFFRWFIVTVDDGSLVSSHGSIKERNVYLYRGKINHTYSSFIP